MSEQQITEVWREWNALDDGAPAPVKTISRKLGMSRSDVAAIVYPPATFGAWEDWHEPPLEGETEPPEHTLKRQGAERRFEVDDDVRGRALGDSGR